MAEIDRWEQKLSYYRDDSDVRQINAEAAQHPVYLDPATFGLLKRARELMIYRGHVRYNGCAPDALLGVCGRERADAG